MKTQNEAQKRISYYCWHGHAEHIERHNNPYHRNQRKLTKTKGDNSCKCNKFSKIRPLQIPAANTETRRLGKLQAPTYNHGYEKMLSNNIETKPTIIYNKVDGLKNITSSDIFKGPQWIIYL